MVEVLPSAPTRLGDFTWSELDQWLSTAIAPTLLLPVGAFEQHGPSLPLETDTVITGRIAGELSSRLEIVLGPTISIGASDSHLGFPGTVSCGEQILSETLRRVTSQFLAADRLGIKHKKMAFQRVILLTAHAGNIGPLQQAEQLGGVQALPGWWELDDCKEVIRSAQMTEGTHADETEMSLMLYYGYNLRRRSPVGPFQIAEDPGPTRPDTRAISPNGILAPAVLRPSVDRGALIHNAAVRGYTTLLLNLGIICRSTRTF